MSAVSSKAPSIRASIRPGASPPLSAYTLRDGQHEVALHEGETLIGRGSDCALILDGGLVSRRHAIVRVQGTRVVVSDLGSRNGTLVNGDQVRGSRDLKPLDRLLVGNVELQLAERSSTHAYPSASMRQAQTITFESVQPATEPAPRQDPNTATLDESLEEDKSTAEMFELIGGVVEMLFALKKTSEAARLLEGPIVRIWKEATRGRAIDHNVADSAADHAVRLAEVTNDDKWVVKALDIFVAQERTLPLPVIDRLYSLLHRLPENTATRSIATSRACRADATHSRRPSASR